MLSDRICQLYANLAELDANFRKDVEQESTWIADVSSNCIDRYREHIEAAYSGFANAAKQNSFGISVTSSVSSTLQREVDILTTTFKKQCVPGGLCLLDAWGGSVHKEGFDIVDTTHCFDEISTKQVTSYNSETVALISHLLSHRLTHELPSMIDNGQDTLFAIRSTLEEERSVSVEFEVTRRARSRHRAHRLTMLESEQRELRTSLESATQDLKDAEQRAAILLSKSQERSGVIFERFSKWDLLRRRLATVSEGQESCKSAISLLTDHIVEGSQFGTTVQVDSSFGPLLSKSVAGVPGHGRMVGTGSVEWLHRMLGHWNSTLRECGRSDMICLAQVDQALAHDETTLEAKPPMVDLPAHAHTIDLNDATTNTCDPRIGTANKVNVRAPPPTPTRRKLPTNDGDVTKDMMLELLSRDDKRKCSNRFDPLNFQLSSPRR